MAYAFFESSKACPWHLGSGMTLFQMHDFQVLALQSQVLGLDFGLVCINPRKFQGHSNSTQYFLIDKYTSLLNCLLIC